MSNYQTFRHYRISQDAHGAAVELWRSDADIVCLAVDTLRQVFVELHVAIIDPALSVDLRTFQSMALALGQVRSPHVIEVVDSGEDEGAMYAVTEFIDGERLDTYLARSNPVPVWLALQILTQLAAGMESLSAQPRLLVNVELFNATVQLLGETPQDISVKLADFRLALLPAKEELLPHRIIERLVQDSGRLLAYMLTGSASDVSIAPNALRQLGPEMSTLVTILTSPGHPNHPASLTDLGLLLEGAVAALPTEQATVPAKLPPSLRPKLPLQVHLASAETVAASLASEFQVSGQDYDAATPYQLISSARETRHAATVQLLPPERLMSRDFMRAIRSTQQRVNALDHPHLLRVQNVSDDEGLNWLVEESGGRMTLADLHLLKRPMSPSDAVIVLEHLQEAWREAEACGLTPVVRSLRQIYVQFRPAKGMPMPQEKDFVSLPMEEWPPFYLRVRTYPTTLNLTQPGRYVLERQVGELPMGSDPGTPGKLSSLLTAAAARDFAMITSWLTAGHPNCGEKMRHLLLDYLAPKKGRSTPTPSKEFLDRLSILVGRSATRKIEAPTKPSRKSKQAVEEAAESAQFIDHIPVVEAAPAFGEMVSGKTVAKDEPAPAPKPATKSTARSFGSPAENQPASYAPVGFAEALFTPQRNVEAEYEPEPVHPILHFDEEEQHPLFGDLGNGSEQNSVNRGGIKPEFLQEDPEIKPRRGLLILWVVLIALLIAFLAAQLGGTGFWLKQPTEPAAPAGNP